MALPTHPTLIARQRDARVKELVPRCPPLAASLVQIARRCGNPRCRCARGEKHVGWYLTRKEKGKTRTVYVPVDLTEEVRAWVEEHQRLKKLVEEISQLNLALIRSHVTQRRRRKGRT